MINRGSGLSTLGSYVPAVSSYGNVFYKWTNQPITSLYTGLFYNYTNSSPFLIPISTICGSNYQVSSSMYYNIPILSSFSYSNISTLNVISTIDASSILSLGNTISTQSTLIFRTYSTVNAQFSSITPGISTTVSVFYSNLFSPTETTFVNTGTSLYVLSDLNPTPVRYIGPGISSLVTIFIYPDIRTYPYYTNVTSILPSLLSNISSGLYASNASIDSYRNIFNTTIQNANLYIDNGSSLSTLYWSTTNSFVSSLDFASTFSLKVSEIYLYASTILSTATDPPTLKGFQIGEYISTTSTLFTFNFSTLASQLNSSMVSSVLLTPFSNFSTTKISSLTSTYATFAKTDVTPGLLFLQSTFFGVVDPFYLNLDISTNRYGYQNISTVESKLFSTFSIAFPYILGTSQLSSLSLLNTGISSLSTQITVNTNALYDSINSYITGPGISSMAYSLSTNTGVSIYNYMKLISSIYIPFSNAVRNINAIPGLCTLNSSVINYHSSISSISQQIPIQFSNYFVQQTTNSLALSSLGIFTANYRDQYISTGLLAFSTNTMSFGNISSGITTNSNYISSLLSPQGTIQASLNSLYALQTNVLDIIIPFFGSTIYYPMLPIITDYSTSRYAIPDPYISRSTFFSSATTRIQSSFMSSITVSNVNIQTYANGPFALDIIGSVNLQGLPANTGIPTLTLPNFSVYASETLISSFSTMMMSARFSSIVFNQDALVMQRIYNNQRYGLVGINTGTPAYSLDIGFGDARKPSGTDWITVSDARIKANISTPDPDRLRSQILDLNLVEFNWSAPFQQAHGASDQRVLGFISQDVQKIFPDSVLESKEPENNIPGFLSLDTDQLRKAKFAVTQQLLCRLSSLQMRINALLKES